MEKIRIGDFVTRKSHGKDIVFYVKNIIKTHEEKIAIICGVSQRIEADSKIDDLVKVSKKLIKKQLYEEENRLWKRYDNIEKTITGKILHLDGDRRYSHKSANYYRKWGLDAIVKNIPEYKQPELVYSLLKTYNPDILVITGHDRNDKKKRKY